ncbi:Cyanovirin-N [Tirmania nivea]|nr:Cyanovirin-N [Tirmania nivea]
MGGSFQASSIDIYIQWKESCETILHCMARDESGNLRNAQITLDYCIGNYDGKFVWGGKDFTQSARKVYFHIEQYGSLANLHADLINTEGEWVHRVINLGERIINDDGCLVFQLGY